MAELSRTEMERYLKSVVGPSVRILNLKVLGESEEKDIKGYGYGTPVQIDYECEGKQRHAVLQRQRFQQHERGRQTERRRDSLT